MNIGENVIELDVVESTNKTAAELLSLSKAMHGTVILANMQTQGRGQRGRVWHTGVGLDLALSVIVLPPALRVEEQFGLSKMVALAVRDSVQAFVRQDVRIKWPNDILVERRKLAGILIECELVADRVRSAIIGIGLNVNSCDFEAQLVASSLHLESGLNVDRKAVLDILLEALRTRYSQWIGDPNGVDVDYTAALWSKDRWADMVLDGVVENLRPIDVDRWGRLLVEHLGGRVAAYGLDRLRFAPR